MTAGAKRRMRVMHLIPRLPVGGVENMLYKIVTGYDASRIEATVCCMKEGGAVADMLRDGGVPVRILGRMQGHGFDLGLIRLLRAVLRAEKIDVLRTHQYHANLYGRIAGVLAGVPAIIPSFHNLYRSPERPKLHRRMLNHLLSHGSDALVAVSAAVAADVIRYDRVDPGKMRVIHNGVDDAFFTSAIPRGDARSELGIPNDVFVVGSTGRLTEQKAHSVLVEAMADMNACLVIAGDGPLRKQLEDAAAALKVRCIILGRVRPDVMPVFLNALDLFCFPSLWEGLPSALAEAMASGLPIIASDIAPNREVLGDTGLTVPVGESGGLRRAIIEVMRNEELRRGLASGAGRRAAQFAIGRTVERYEALYREVLGIGGGVD